MIGRLHSGTGLLREKHPVVRDTMQGIKVTNGVVREPLRSFVQVVKKLTMKKAYEITMETHKAGRATVTQAWKSKVRLHRGQAQFPPLGKYAEQEGAARGISVLYRSSQASFALTSVIHFFSVQ